MNLPTSSIRGFFEILMPGIFLLLNLFMTSYLWLFPRLEPTIEPRISKLIFDPAISAATIIGFGYLLGVVLRLMKTEKIDLWSSWVISHTKDRRRPLPLYLSDHFCYRNWMLQKFEERLSPEVAAFFIRFWAPKHSDRGEKDTTLFNFYKTIVAKLDPLSSAEIAKDEAVVRFVAGSFYALLCSTVLLFIDLFLASRQYHLLVFAVGVVYLVLLWIILREFRLLRSKEVDTVFFATFANRVEFEKLFSRPNGQQQLLTKAWSADQEAGALTLGSLVEAMRQSSKSGSGLSSLYFAGADVDHPFFLKTDALAMGIAVLPEDAEKARRPKRHPHQTEVIFILEGALTLHLNGKPPKLLTKHEHFVIERNACHWISPVEGKSAVFAFVKTNPAEEPRGLDCNDSL